MSDDHHHRRSVEGLDSGLTLILASILMMGAVPLSDKIRDWAAGLTVFRVRYDDEDAKPSENERLLESVWKNILAADKANSARLSSTSNPDARLDFKPRTDAP